MATAALPHVLLVVDGFPKALGGGERVVLRLAELLPAYGYRTSILTFRIHPESTVLRSPPPCPLYLLPLQRTYGLASLRAAWTFRRFLRAENVRLVMTFFESADLWAGAVTRLLSPAKLVWNRRDMGILRERKHSLAYRWLARAPHRIFAVSEKVRRYTIEVDRVAPRRVETVYNGLDLSRFQALPTIGASAESTPSGLHITTVGNLRHVKGHDVLLRAAASVLARFPETRFSIAGAVLEPAYAAELHRLAQELGIAANVSFPGPITDLPTYLVTADIFVLPSRSEGFSNAILEAMACGLPVVGTDVGGNSEAVEDGVTGLIVPPEAPDRLADALSLLIADPQKARQMGVRGRERVQERFSEEAVLHQISRAFSQLLGTPKA